MNEYYEWKITSFGNVNSILLIPTLSFFFSVTNISQIFQSLAFERRICNAHFIRKCSKRKSMCAIRAFTAVTLRISYDRDYVHTISRKCFIIKTKNSQRLGKTKQKNSWKGLNYNLRLIISSSVLYRQVNIIVLNIYFPFCFNSMNVKTYSSTIVIWRYTTMTFSVIN